MLCKLHFLHAAMYIKFLVIKKYQRINFRRFGKWSFSPLSLIVCRLDAFLLCNTLLEHDVNRRDPLSVDAGSRTVNFIRDGAVSALL